MPRKSLDPGSKPFEIKVGIGFAAFGGMHQLGDPSMCPPNRFRRLVNVRLGDKDVVSRPGLATQWSGSAEPVLNMAEIDRAREGKIYFGPFGISGFADPLPSTFNTTHLISALIVDQTFPYPFPGGDIRVLGTYVLGYIPIRQDFTSLTPQEIVQGQASEQPGGLGGVGHDPVQQTGMVDGAPFLIEPIYSQTNGAAGSGDTIWCPYSLGASIVGDGTFTFTHGRKYEVAFSTLGGFGTLVQDQAVNFPDDFQRGNCLDAVVYFQGKWLATGSTIPVLSNPAVLAGKPSGSPGTGQQIFELKLGPDVKVPAGLPPLIAAGGPPGIGFEAAGLQSYFGGALTEVFRMPGVSHEFIPTRASGGLDGKTVRSMCVRSVRANNPSSGAPGVDEKLYLGTFGGYPITPAYWKVQDEQLVHAIHNLTDGEVYSWDGSTLKLELGSLGPAVVVVTLPDGSILACGRTAAAMLDARDETWKVVTYSPTFDSLPRVLVAPFYGTTKVASLADPDWKSKGFIWTDRVIYNGEAYYAGHNTARCATNAVYSTGAGIYTSAAPIIFGLHAPGEPPFPGGRSSYTGTPDQYVIYRFDQLTLTMVRVRTGVDIWESTGNPVAGLNIPTSPGVNGGPRLAVFNKRLYYSFRGDFGNVFPNPDVAGPGTPRGAPWCGIGEYDGLTWRDYEILSHSYNPITAFPRPAFVRNEQVTDMLATARGVYIGLHGDFPVFANVLLRWDGSTLNTLVGQWGGADWSAGGQGGRMFLGPQ